MISDVKHQKEILHQARGGCQIYERYEEEKSSVCSPKKLDTETTVGVSGIIRSVKGTAGTEREAMVHSPVLKGSC